MNSTASGTSYHFLNGVQENGLCYSEPLGFHSPAFG